ncbi:hypothetical protein N7492_010509 [Penicillium capsulatum]|uniref:GPI anchored protein n=1 Tax=Penicillium capsulatum TaxID=69766 RepID=A0A9W9LEZ7_9EURO|nr:hypothetical protein N7492_010509 [Penicillium capsulatum]
MRPSVLLVSTLSLASSIVAQDIDANDLPTQCKDVCAPVVSLTASCDKKTSDDDTAERNCVCKDSRAAKSIPVCAACLTTYSKDGGDNVTMLWWLLIPVDANDLVRSCSLTTTSFGSVTSTSMSGSSTTGATDAMTSGATTASTTSGSVSSMSSTGSGSASSTTPASTSNAANGPIQAGNGMVGAIFAGLMALA